MTSGDMAIPAAIKYKNFHTKEQILTNTSRIEITTSKKRLFSEVCDFTLCVKAKKNCFFFLNGIQKNIASSVGFFFRIYAQIV